MSATQVPLHPIAKGSVMKLWLALLALTLFGVAFAYASTAPLQPLDSLQVETVTEGTGELIGIDDGVLVSYEGRLRDGTVFDQSGPQPAPLLVQGVVPGFRDALLQMREGGSYEVAIPSDQAYGSEAPPVIGPDQDLYFTMTVERVIRGAATQMGIGAPPAQQAPAIGDEGIDADPAR